MNIRLKLATVALAVCAAVPAYSQGAAAVGSICKDGSADATVGRGACSRHGGVDKDATQKAKAAAKVKAKAATPAASVAATATVTCKDGTTANAGRGACGHHGGVGAAVAVAAPAAPATAAPAKAPAARTMAAKPAAKTTTAASAQTTTAEQNNPQGASAKCKDGTYSHAKNHQGACGHHGGVAQWLQS